MNSQNIKVKHLRPSPPKSGDNNLNMKSNVNFNLFHSSSNYNIMNFNDNYLPQLFYSSQNYFDNNIETLHKFSSEFKTIKNMWNDLGVNEKYKILFSNYLIKLNQKEKIELLESEKSYLKKFRDSLLKLSKEISIREKNIQNLKLIENELQKNINCENKKKIESILNEIKQLIIQIRLNSINIVNYINKIREVSSYNINREKFNLDNINKAYKYNKNILIKMDKEMDFLKNSIIHNYFYISDLNYDTFFSNFINEEDNNNENKEKIIIPFDEGLINSIKNAKYIILQDKFLNKIEEDNNNKNQKNKHLITYKKVILKNKWGMDNSRTPSAKCNFKINRDKFLNHENNVSHFLNKIKQEKGRRGYNGMFLKKKIDSFDHFEHKNNLFQSEYFSFKNEKGKEKEKKEKENEKEKEKEKKNIKNENDIEFYTNSINDLIQNIKKQNYYDNIPEKIKQVFDINDNYFQEENFLKGFQPKILISKNKENLINGLCKLSFENYNNIKKAIIEHLSIINLDLTIIEKLIKFIINNLSFNEILISLNYLKNEKKYEINNDIINLFKNKLNFKWLSIENSINENRKKTLYYIKNGTNNLEEKYILINSISIISLSNIQSESLLNNEKYINTFLIYSLLNEKNRNKDIILKKLNDKGNIFEYSNNKNSLNSLVDINLNLQNLNEINDILKKQKLNFVLNSLEYKNNKQCDLISLKLNLKVNKGISFKYNNYIYNRIEGEIMLLNNENNNNQFYVIQSNDNSNSILISQLTKELKSKIINNQKNIYEIFNSLYCNISKENNKKNKKIIYIPSFNIKSQLSSNNINSIENNISINNVNNEKLFFDSIDEIFDVQWNYDEDLINNFQILPNETNDDIIIKDSFIFGIINYSILASYKIPFIQLYFVTKEHWNKI